ncbi:MAG: hypothetical protein ACQETH_08930 [Candidatus Rifleibacteriota bacterium]
MQVNEQNYSANNDRVGMLEIIAGLGFFILIVSNFMSFTPVEERTWREFGLGFPAVIAGLAGIYAILRKLYFTSFSIAMFSAFFIIHEVIICYDSKAIAMGRELGKEGWFRSIPLIFADTLKPSFGAFWGIFGISLTVFFILIAWIYSTYCFNQAAVVEQPEDGYIEEEETDFDDSETIAEYSEEDEEDDNNEKEV